jgi:hypothetical protein
MRTHPWRRSKRAFRRSPNVLPFGGERKLDRRNGLLGAYCASGEPSEKTVIEQGIEDDRGSAFEPDSMNLRIVVVLNSEVAPNDRATPALHHTSDGAASKIRTLRANVEDDPPTG